MILHEICGRTESHPIYQHVEAANGARHYDFLRTLVEVCLMTGRPFLSGHIIKALNFHAITCLHVSAGEYRTLEVGVGDPEDKVNYYLPPRHYLVQSYMDDCINVVNRNWERSDPLSLGAFVLWRLNHIHPFINGNGRTARATAYFVICLKLDGWLPGSVILPELLTRNRDEYVAALKHADAAHKSAGDADLLPLRSLIERLLQQQVAAVQADPAAKAPIEGPPGAQDPGAKGS